jgi:hypothetical protein
MRNDGRGLFEERIVVATAKNARSALGKCRAAGRRKQYSYIAASGDTVTVEFVGITQLLRLDLLCEEDEVWYSLHNLLVSSRRKKPLLRDEEQLDAVRYEPRGQKTGRQKMGQKV